MVHWCPKYIFTQLRIAKYVLWLHGVQLLLHTFFTEFVKTAKHSYYFQSNLNNCLVDGTFVLNWYVTALPAQPQSIIGLPPSSTTWQRRQVRCRLITKALMREPAAAWSCRNPCCLAGLMAIPWGHTLVLPQHAGKYGSNHKSKSPAP